MTASGRFNNGAVDIDDHLGTSLDGTHPTAAELSCADPDEPCLVPNAFVSDPPLEQAVARSLQAGLRGRWSGDGGGSRQLTWSAAAYRTRIADDILFIASPELIGTGYFQNAGDTSRVGAEVERNGRVARFGWYASYGLVEATFESPLIGDARPTRRERGAENGQGPIVRAHGQALRRFRPEAAA